MHPELRARFNADFTPEKYAALVRCVNETEKWPADFRISETPIFLTRDFTDDVTRAANAIVDATRDAGIRETSGVGRFRKDWKSQTNRLTQIFSSSISRICAEEDRLVPRLIELQAFPSLFGFQLLLLGCIRKAYPVIPRTGPLRLVESKTRRISNLLRRTIIADSAPENVVLLEIEPEKQKTRIDFAATETLLGIRPVCADENQEARPPVVL